VLIKGNNGVGNDRMRWVMLLFAVAVILPTVCLLWFMTQAVRNERLAIREKLLTVYKGNLRDSVEYNFADNKWININLALAYSDGFLIFDGNDNLIFPVEDVSGDIISDEIFDTAYQFEYVNDNPAAAIAEYNEIANRPIEDTLRIRADMASVRCMKKINHTDVAIEKLREILSKYNDDKIQIRSQKIRAHLSLVEMLQKKNNEEFKNELSVMFDYAADNIDTDEDLVLMGTRDFTGKYMPTSLQLFVLERFLLYAEPMNNDPQISKKVKRAERIAPKLKMSLEMSNIFKDISFISNTGILNSTVFRLDTEGQLYGHYLQIDSNSLGTRKYLKIYLQSTIENWFQPYIKDMEELPAQCIVYDEKGDIAAGEIITDIKPFIKSELNIGYFPGYTTELYIHSSAFEDAADKQAAVYMWAGVLVIVLMLATGGLAGRAMGRQIKMNRLKNDFIATISHELKTPLASMRVLADTLLEGNYRDQQQVTEYLQLICKENKRLSGLIDNFLTFSRMERNKQKFDIIQTSPASIARAAVEAVKTKFDKRQCEGRVEISENLPDIMADHDAMVTVLVNLLDNACKYSYDNKHIQLKVYSEDNCICFAVKDNGIGMTRRQIRKIFNRFYQADSTLSRRAEGTGLGLSIVKFIVDAHKGRITVDSKPSEGSTFTVMLPVGN